MDAMNFNNFTRRSLRESNYRLLEEPVKLKVRMEHFPTAEEANWEGEGGAPAPVVTEMTTEEYNRSTMRVRGARKQRAARAYIPRESIRVVPIKVARSPKELEDLGLSQEVQVAELKAHIEKLMGIVDARKKKVESIVRLAEHFNVQMKAKVVK